MLLDFARMHRELGLSCLLPLPKALFEVFYFFNFQVLEGSAMTSMGLRLVNKFDVKASPTTPPIEPLALIITAWANQE